MLNVIFTRMEMQAMEIGAPKDESEISGSCEINEPIQSDDSVNQELTDDIIIVDLINEICDSAIESLNCDTKTKELAQDIVRSMSQVCNFL